MNTTAAKSTTCTYRQKCIKCPIVLESPTGDWPTLYRIVVQHWEVCAGSLARLTCHDAPAQMTIAPTPNPQSPPRISTKSLGIRRKAKKKTLDQGRRKTRKNKTLEERRRGLEADPYAYDVTAKTVMCRGCHGLYKLDQRSDYFPLLWNKHRDKCEDVKKMKLAKAAEALRPSDDGELMSACTTPGRVERGHRDAIDVQRY
ncbi:hypothetical protein DEU56DRAFT_791781 [Suillus clintonianus]|uniref:uncharacterized protein n=1 Tax=Suillus clintonianus TaxID=1904413 RepID=UPI001B86D7B1|nr:uncharacterized protein DEU56DRAFT_791781 [Suillus clintonianus]KAG2143657.1 hypothetical protein DEU56DRAFT_791781 [Suillus clintonianus]